MRYPSLLYRDPPAGRPLSLSVFEDLQITQLIRTDVLEAVLSPCGKDNILARNELFRAAEREPFLALLDRLDASLVRAEELYRIYTEAHHEGEKAVIFASLLSEAIAFAHLAAPDPGAGELYGRFSAFFREELNGSALKAAEEELKTLLPTLGSFVRCSFRVHDKEIVFRPKGEDSYLSALRTCARELSLDPPEEPLFLPRQLSPVILGKFAAAYPKEFGAFLAFEKKYASLFDPDLLSYRLPVEFYLTFTRLLERVRANRIPVTYPTLSEERVIRIGEAYDISLFAKNEYDIVPNDVLFTPDEPFFYLTGANGGGKTTYLRTVGISLVFLLLGIPLPCASAVVSVPDGIYTHFPRDERFEGTGRFVEENRRVERILNEMTGNSVVLLNETYSTTNEENAVEMTEKLADTLWEKRIFGLYITHQHSLKESAIPYLNVLIDADDSNRRTFKIARQRTTGGSFAEDILKKYALTKEALENRFGEGML